MVKVAIAGGASNIGRHIVEEILATKKHTVVVLSRSASHSGLEALGAQIAAVDYANHASLTAALAGVYTVISALSILDPTPQLVLLDAAVKAGVTRFAPSEWATRSIPDNHIEWFRGKWTVAEAVRKSGLEYTIFETGIFMNYLAVGTPGLGHLKPIKFLFDVENGTAQIPGDGSAYMVYTSAEDVGKFVAASLDWEKWPEYSQMIGDRLTLSEVLKLAEAVRGPLSRGVYFCELRVLTGFVGKPFDATYTPKEVYEGIIAKEIEPSWTKFSAQGCLEIVTHQQGPYTGSNLNDAFPEIRPVRVEEFLKKWWTAA